MDRTAARILFSVLALFAPVRSFGQEVLMPFIVEGPRISRTAFTNWESIELSYTVRWADGYEPVLAELKPQSMSFGILELDPEFSDEADTRNKRRFEKENFFDITYHLRYMGEKKGEIIIPGLKFAYRDLMVKGSEVQYFQTQDFKLAYGTVLTSDAEDIKEELDLGSYQGKAMFSKVLAGIVFLVGVIGSFVLVFFKPVPVPLAVDATKVESPQLVRKITGPTEIVDELLLDITTGNIGSVCNGLSDLIRVYVSGIKPGMTSKEMAPLILSIHREWERKQLLQVHAALCDIEACLFSEEGDISGKVESHMANLPETIRKLKPGSVYWHRQLFSVKAKLAKPFSYLHKVPWRKT